MTVPTACRHCSLYNGDIVKISETIEGDNIPLWNPRCRCTTVAYFDDEIDLGKFGNVFDIDDLDVDWELSSIHAFEKNESRNISKTLVEDIINNGKSVEQITNEKYAYVSPKGVVILRKDGKFITTRSEKDFDDNMKNIVKKLFGDDK